MKEKAKYTEAFRKQALEKVYTRGSGSAAVDIQSNAVTEGQVFINGKIVRGYSRK